MTRLLLPLLDSPKPRLLRLYKYRLPLRQYFRHAAAARDVNEGIIVRLELDNGVEGLGEGIPRPYVTGETVASAIEAVEQIYASRLASANPLAAGPVEGSAEGVWHNAAWCACELALLDAAARSARLPLAEFLSGRLSRPLHHKIPQRVAGVLSAEAPDVLMRSLRRMWWFGLRDFKLKVAAPEDRECLRAALAYLGPAVAKGQATIRVDANGGWSLDQARQECRRLVQLGIAAIEQPLRRGDEADLPALRRQALAPIMLDESLLEPRAAARLAAAGAADFWNLRISKNGGLLQTLELADLARQNKIGLMLGAMVGESGILAAAARVILQLVPEIRFLENSYGRFLLEEDLVEQRTRFGYGGRIAPLPGPGLGVTLDLEVFERLTEKVAQILL
jgi:muconate cycloisomerase